VDPRSAPGERNREVARPGAEVGDPRARPSGEREEPRRERRRVGRTVDVVHREPVEDPARGVPDREPAAARHRLMVPMKT
jgi:hypothetical protein